MSHVGTDALWALLKGEASAEEEALVQAHLTECPECRRRAEEVRAARLVAQSHAVPPLTPRQWDRIGAKVRQAAAQELEAQRGVRRTRRRNLRAAGAGLMAMAAALLFWALWPSQAPSPAGPPTPAPTPLAAPLPQPPVPLEAQVAVAVETTSGGRPVVSQQRLSKGAKVTTSAKGRVELALPAGARAAVEAHTEVRLSELSERRVGLELERGVVELTAEHRPERVLVVRAGEVEVEDLGTEFTVARSATAVLVAVSEGRVAVRAGGQARELEAGMALRYEAGRFQEGTVAPAPAEVRPPPKRPSPKASREQPPPEEEGSPELAWEPWSGQEAKAEPPPPKVTQPPLVPDPVPEAPGAAAGAPSGGADGGEDDEPFFIRLPKKLVKLVPKHIDAPFAPINSNMREQRAREVERLADQGECEGALARADAWLQKYATSDGGATEEEWRLRKVVRQAQVRCLSKLGRIQEADRIRLDPP